MLCRRTVRQKTQHGQKSPLMGDLFTDSQRVMPPAEHACPFWGIQRQVLDSFQIRRENALRCDAHYAAGAATITNYDGAAPAAELDSSASVVASALDAKEIFMDDKKNGRDARNVAKPTESAQPEPRRRVISARVWSSGWVFLCASFVAPLLVPRAKGLSEPMSSMQVVIMFSTMGESILLLT